ncbi:MAG: hypothetical protein BRD50_06780, partial [Bacteroidetes bacterium SW_11_45_7]
MIAGQYPDTIFIQSNDPDSSNYLLPTLLTINVPHAIGLSDTSVDLGSHMIGDTHQDTFTISNPVCDTLEITDITTTDSVYTVNDTSFSILPYDSQRVTVTFAPTAIQTYDDTLTIFNSASDTSVFLQGEGLGAPVISTTPSDSLFGTITGCNDSVTLPLSISNTGGTDTLEWALSTSEPKNVTTTQDSGELAIDSSTTVQLTFYGKDLVDGDAFYSVTINSNDPVNPSVQLPARITLQGNPFLAVSDSLLSMDTLKKGAIDVDSFTVYNRGCDTMNISSLTTSDSAFTVDTASAILQPFDSMPVLVTFQPDSIKDYNETLSITSDGGDTTLALKGKGLPAPQASVSPDTLSTTFTGCNDTVYLPVTITNSGSDTLEWRGIKNPGLNDDFESGDFSKHPWDKNSGDADWMIVSNQQNSGTYSARSGNITHDEQSTLQVTKDVSAGTLSFYRKISSEGNYDYLRFYIDGSLQDSWSGTSSWVQESYSVSSGTHTFKWVYDKDGSVSNNADAGWIDDIAYGNVTDSGNVAVNATDTFNVMFTSTGLTNGQYTDRVKMTTNDPLNSSYTIPTIKVVNGPSSIALSDTNMNVGSHMVGTSGKDTFKVYNTGCDSLRVGNMATTDTVFSVSDTSLVVPPFDSSQVIVTFTPDTIQPYTAQLTIQNNDQDTSITLNAVGLGAPSITVSPDSMNVTIAQCDDSTYRTLKIYNKGGTNQLNWFALSSSKVEDDFDPGIDSSNWSSIQGGSAASGCGTVSGANALYFDGSNTREVITKDLNVSGDGLITFHLKIGTGGGSCESADNGEEVALAYSTDGGATWSNINVYDTDNYPSFALVQEVIPQSARTSSTRFRWRQLSNSGSGFDHWAVDDVAVDLFSGSPLNPDSGTVAIDDSVAVD